MHPFQQNRASRLNLFTVPTPTRREESQPYPGLTHEAAESILMRQRPGGLACLPDRDLLEADEPGATERYIEQLSAIAEPFGAEVWGIAHMARRPPVWWRYRGMLFEVTPAAQKTRHIPMMTYHRIESVLAAGFRVHTWLWADELDAAVDPASSAFSGFSDLARREDDDWSDVEWSDEDAPSHAASRVGRLLNAPGRPRERSLGWLDPVYDPPAHLPGYRPHRLIPPFVPIVPPRPASSWSGAAALTRQAEREAARRRDPMVVAATCLSFAEDVVLLTILGKWLEPH